MADTLDRLPKFANPDEEEAFLSWYSGQMQDNGWPRHPKDAPDDPRAAFLAAQEDDDSPDTYSSPALQGAPPSVASATEETNIPEATAKPASFKGGTPSLQEWLPAAKKANPRAEPKELKQYWNQKYGHIDPATLPTWEEFRPKAQAANPNVPEDELEDYWQEKYGDLGAGLKRPPEPSDFIRGMETGVKQIPMLGHGIEAGIGAVGEKIFGEGGVSTAIKEHGIKGYQEASENIEKSSRPSDSATTAWEMAKSGNPGALVDFLQFGLGYAATQGAEMLATGGIGYALGKLGLQGTAKLVGEKLIAKEAARLSAAEGAKLTGEALTKQAVANVAGRIGQTTALAAAAGGMEGGEIYGDLVTQAQKDGRELSGGDLAKAFGFTVGAGALEFVGDKFGFDIMAGKSSIGKLAGEATGFGGRAARGAIQGAVGAGVEAGTELGQTFLEQAGKGQEIGTPDSIREAVDSAALGAVGGGTVGGLSGLSTKPIKTVQIPKALGVGDPNVSVNEAIQEAAKILADTEVEADLAQANAEANDLAQRARAEMATILAPERTRTSPTDTPILNAGEEPAPIRPFDGMVPAGAPQASPAAQMEALRRITRTEPEPSPIVPGTAYTPRQDEQPIPDQVVSPRTRTPEGEPAIIQPGGPAFQGIYPTGAPVPSEEAKAAAAKNIKGIEGTYKTGQPTAIPQTGIEAERARLQAMQAQAQKPLTSPSEGPSEALATPALSPQDIHTLAQSKGLDPESATFKEYTKLITGKSHLDELTPAELQAVKTQLEILKRAERKATSEPVNPIADATVPRSELPPQQNAEMLARAEKAKAELESGVADSGPSIIDFLRKRGGVQDQGGELSTMEIDREKKPSQRNLIRPDGLTLDDAAEAAHEAGLIEHRDIGELLAAIDKEARGSSGADWYREATTGPQKLSKERVDAAVAKIIADKGRDTGKDVERIKQLLLQDGAFQSSPFAPKSDKDWETLIEAATGTATPTPPSKIEQEKQKLEAMKKPTKAALIPTRGGIMVQPLDDDGNPVGQPHKAGEEPKPTKAGQQEIAVPPPTVGERPIIGREPQPGEAPLFSPSAQLPDVEQPDLLEQTAEAAPASGAEVAPNTDPKVAAAQKVANFVEARLTEQRNLAPGVLAFSSDDLFKRADYEFGGTRAEGKYTEKDAYDALEMGVNQYIMGAFRNEIPAHPMDTLPRARTVYKELKERVLDRIPTQKVARTEEQNEFQQFSTPPPLSFVMAYAANVTASDTVLEPSAGLGGLAVFAKNEGATVVLNEYSGRRADLLESLDLGTVYREKGEQLNNILPESVKPTVVIMNPPFSSTAGRMAGQRKSANVIPHLEQALKRLEPGGRLVALIGRGKADFGGETSKAVDEWIKLMAMKYAYRARIGLSGKDYKKYGTTFDNQILIFDKIAPDGKPVVTANLETAFEALNLLTGVRDARQHKPVEGTQSTAAESGSEAVAAPGESGGQRGSTVSAPTDVVGAGGSQAQPGTQRPAGATGTTQAGGVRPAQQSGQGGSVSVPPDRIGQSEGTTATQPAHPAKLDDARGSGATGAGESVSPGGERSEPGQQLPPRALELEAADDTPNAPESNPDAIFETYTPKAVKVAGAHKHPGKLVESAAMAAIDPPPATYQPTLPQEVITKGKLSLPQLESVVYNGQAQEQFLPSGERMGFFDGDGTGVGKGRQIAGIILNRLMQGDKRAVWVSKNAGLYEDAMRDWKAVTGREDIHSQGDVDLNGKIDLKSGVLFTYYSLIGGGLDLSPQGELVAGIDKKTGKPFQQTRFSQLRDWLGKDYDGAIVFDEAHEMRNNIRTQGARGDKEPAMKALAGVELQKLFPKARISYFSATGGIEVSDFGYAERLGMWGAGTSFAKKQDFFSAIASGGMASMELVAQDLKANGLYVSRSLSYDDVTFERMTHDLTPQQREMYDAMARAWQIIIRNIRQALDVTGAGLNGKAKGAAYSALWGAQLRFFDQILVTMQMPTVLKRMRTELDAGNAVVISLTKTNESALKREMTALKARGAKLDELDMTPRQMMVDYLRASFPVHEFETFLDDNGNERSRLVVDSAGRPVENKEAVAMRESIISDLEMIRFPETAMDQIFKAFGYKDVAEVTGRSQRVVYERQDDGSLKPIQQTRSKAIGLKEAREFMDDKRKILIFSDAGGTGASYHADNEAKNKRKRVHIPIQPGWRADAAMQAMGRVHRTNQASAPHYILPSTDLKGHNRFISTIARRLSQLGALTKGQQQTGSQGLFSERDNLENPYSSATILRFFQDLRTGSLGRFGWSDLIEKLGLNESKLLDDNGNLRPDELPDIPQFLNRLLTLEYTDQNDVFDEFMSRMDTIIERAKANGTFNAGMENVRHDGATLDKTQVVYTDDKTQAKTKLQTFTVRHNVDYIPFKGVKNDDFIGFYQSEKKGTMYAVYKSRYMQETKEDGTVVQQVKLQAPNYEKRRYVNEETFKKNYTKFAGDAEATWNEAIRTGPQQDTETMHILAGAMLRIWNRLPKYQTRVVRLITDDGKRTVGRVVPDSMLDDLFERLGIKADKKVATPTDIVSTLEEGGTAELVNGWTFKQSLVDGEERIELDGDDLYSFREELRKAGVMIESRNYKARFFIPTDRAEEILTQLTKTRPVLKLRKKQRKAGGLSSAHREGGLSNAHTSDPFYSQLERTIETKMPARASFEQIKGILNSGGVKADELQWTGLDDYLKTKDYFTKQDVLDFLQANNVQVEEVMKGEPSHDVEAWWNDEGGANEETPWAELTPEEQAGATVDYQEQVGQYEDNATKFQQYQLPGGSDYRELLLTLPEKPALNVFEVLNFKDHHVLARFPTRAEAEQWMDDMKKQQPNVKFNIRETYKSSETNFTGGHWSEPNVLAHIRFNTRTVDGKKVLFLEEIQSDWHQKGRKGGYDSGPQKKYRVVSDDINLTAEFDTREEAEAEIKWAKKQRFPPVNPRIEEFETPSALRKGVPDAPFKKTWHELALKRMLRYAAENGYDSLAWTTGEQQAERYDLSKQIDSIHYIKNSDGTFNLSAVKDGEEVIGKEDQTKEQVADLIGKELADKMDAGAGQVDTNSDDETFKSLSGLDLKVGGEGMKGFYDTILPTFLTKYGKKWNATVGELTFPVQQYVEGSNAARNNPPVDTTVHALPITEAMKESVLAGQPLFAKNKYGDVESHEAESVQAAIEGKSVVQAAEFLAKHAPSDADKLIAQRVADQIHAMEQAGMEFQLHVAHVGEMVPRALIGSRGLVAKRHDSNVTHVWLNGADVTGYVGTSYQTLLHELIHAATQRAIYAGNLKQHQGKPFSDTVQDLYAVSNAIVRHFNTRVKAGAELTPFEESIHKGLNNATADPDEIVAWALTNREMQAYLESIPYQGQSFWTAFVEAIRKFLGLPAKSNTALSEVLRISDELLDTPVHQMLDKAQTDDLAVNRTNQEMSNNGLESRQVEVAARGIERMGTLTEAQTEALAHVHGTPETWQEKLNEFSKDWKRRLSQGLVDQFAPILDYSKKAYILARMAMGGEGTLEALLLYGKPYVDEDGAYRVDYSKDKGFNGFSKVLSALQGEHDRFLEWVAALRAENLKEVGLENLYRPEDIIALKKLNDGEMPDGSSRRVAYERALMELNEWNAAMVKIALNSGLITEEYAATLKNLPYVPFYRLQEEGLPNGFGSTPGLEKQYAWKRLKGGTAHLNDDLLANLLQNWSHIITASAKNRAAKETLEAAEAAGVAQEQPAGAPEGKHTVSFKDEGKVRVFTVTDPLLLDAVGAMHYAGLGAIAKPFTMMKRALTFGVTVNPAYKIRNLVRDTIQAIGTADLSYNPLKNIAAGAKATAKDSEIRAQMLAGGGMIRFGSMLDGNSADRTRRLIEQGVDKDSILDDAGKIERFWRTKIVPVFDAYQEFGDRGEQVNRAALYQRLIDKGQSHLEASFWARDLMDFSLTGKWEAVRILTQVVPFLGARLQGLYKIGRAGKEDYRRLGATLGAVALSSIALMLAYKDDDDWKRREDWDRDNYFYLKIGDLAFRIPKPFEIGALATIAERSVEYFVSDEMTGKRFMERLGATVMSQLSMNPTPQLLKPMIDLYANKDSFTQRPIETMGMERLRKADRYTERTSEIARFLGGLGLPDPAKLAMGTYDTLSPVQIDSLVHSYFSWLGTAATTVLDYGIRPLVTRGEKPSMTLHDAFLAGNFVESLPAGSSRYVTQMYENAKTIEEAFGSYRDALKRGDREKAKSILHEEGDKLRQHGIVEQVKRTEGEINTRIKQIERSESLSAEEKRQKIDVLREKKHLLAMRLGTRQIQMQAP